ncbi:hypothetical protein D7210_29025 [Burkholderia cepacia]|nr:hypothetical protein [Burkholderia cepacia]MBB0115766.1 hypothetical protein [Burkholderia cepacia]
MRGARAALGRARHERRARRGRRGIGARRAERGQALTVGAAGRPPGRAVPGLCLLPSAFCLLPSAFCLLPSAFCLPPSHRNALPPTPPTRCTSNARRVTKSSFNSPRAVPLSRASRRFGCPRPCPRPIPTPPPPAPSA